jgi:hypothetical protein
VVLGPTANLSTLAALPRCQRPDGSPMAATELCWTSGQASTAGAALARAVALEARVRRCLDLAAGGER